tara:strand:- start:10044 stop:10481 length:438 start_codon:yes stop_codon:yes gene_type:complete
MLFTHHSTVLTTHTKTAKLEETFDIAKGIITFVSVLFPAGCHNLVHFTLYHREHPIFPSIEGQSIVANAATVEWSEYYEVYQPPFKLKVKAWGDSLSYQHQLTVRIAVLPRKAVSQFAVADSIGKALDSMRQPREIVVPKEQTSA